MAPISNWFSNHGAKCAAIALLALPTILPLLLDTQEINDNRSMAPPPVAPTTWAEFLALPAQADAWVKDHFGFRRELVESNNYLRFKLFHQLPSGQMTAGENGRIFVTAHSNHAAPFSAVVEICEVNKPSLKEFGAYLNVLFNSFEAMGYMPKLMIVPSAPVVQSADLPPWLRDRCKGSDTPMKALLESDYVSDKVKSAIWYPLEQMRARNHDIELFPRTWFHWNGPGIEQIAQDSMSKLFPAVQTAAPRLRTHSSVKPSDVAHFFPGIDLPSKVTEPDYAMSGIASCNGTTCYPEFKGFAEQLYDVSRFNNPAAPDRRLLILSDSFGRYIAGWYSRYYRTVEHVAVNNVKDLQPGQLETLKKFVLRQSSNTDVLFVFHDGALTGTLRLGLQRFHGEQELHRPAEYNLVAQQIYVSYLGRPADLEGLRSFTRQLADANAPIDIQKLNLAYERNAGVREVIDSFGTSGEALAMHPGNSGAFISGTYRRMFGRLPDAGGLTYWTKQVDTGTLTRGRAVLSIAAGALVGSTPQGLRDGALLSKKVSYSALFTTTLTQAKRQCYAGATAAQLARKQITEVGIDTDLRQARVAAARMSDGACK
ncbi:MAG: DUF4214 domain-containing protein [Pseudomonadota bacterium]|nr:DUF4214 domain-containing protein [Pseudomonadota bacterium]